MCFEWGALIGCSTGSTLHPFIYLFTFTLFPSLAMNKHPTMWNAFAYLSPCIFLSIDCILDILYLNKDVSSSECGYPGISLPHCSLRKASTWNKFTLGRYSFGSRSAVSGISFSLFTYLDFCTFILPAQRPWSHTDIFFPWVYSTPWISLWTKHLRICHPTQSFLSQIRGLAGLSWLHPTTRSDPANYVLLKLQSPAMYH